VSATDPHEEHTLRYGDTAIPYTLTFASRKTLGIRVHPDLSVTVVAPKGTQHADIEARLRRRAAWIVRQQRQYERYLPHLPPRQYVSGETHRYLGRQYRLKVVEGEAGEVELGRLYLSITVRDKNDRDRVRDLLDAWYRERAAEVFEERLAACFPKVAHLGVSYPKLSIRAMSTRWGSTSRSGRITLNVKLIQVPTAYIDYVLFHELCHLQESHHGSAYYRLLDRVLPDWRERREALNGYEFG
jgi:predicted metal-dependent hydrolase